MNLVECLKKLNDISFDIFQNQEEITVVDVEGNEIKEIKLSDGKIIIK